MHNKVTDIITEERECEHCGNIFVVNKNKVKRFCSDACRIQAKSIRQIERERKNIKPIPCQQCGKLFVPNAKHRKYCSDECCNIYQSEHGLTDLQNKMTLLSSTKRKEWVFRICKECGKTFRTNRHSGTKTDQQYCSSRCRRIAENNRIKTRRRSAFIKPIACAHCGTEFTPHSAQQKYCSDKCRIAVKVSNEQKRNQKRRKFSTDIVNGVCVLCGESFTRHMEHGGNYHIRFCSKEHYNIANTIRRRLRSQNNSCTDADIHNYFKGEYKAKLERTCRHCNKPFTTNHTHNNKKFCSDKCRVDFYNMHHSGTSIDMRMKRLMERNQNIVSYSTENGRIIITAKCKECGKEFVYPYTNNIKLYCSTKCRNANARKSNRNRKIAFNNGGAELSFAETITQLKNKLRSTEVLLPTKRTAIYRELRQRFSNRIFINMIDSSERNSIKFDNIIKKFGDRFRKTAAVAWVGNHNSASAASKAIRTIIKNEENEQRERALINKRIEEERKISGLNAYHSRVEKSKQWQEKHADEINKKREKTLKAKELIKQQRIDKYKTLSDEMFNNRMAKLNELATLGYEIKYTKCEYCGHLIPYTEPINGRKVKELIGVRFTRFCNNMCHGNWYNVYGKSNRKDEQLVTFSIHHRGNGFYVKHNNRPTTVTVKQKYVERYLNGQKWVAKHDCDDTDTLINRIADLAEIDPNTL